MAASNLYFSEITVVQWEFLHFSKKTWNSWLC